MGRIRKIISGKLKLPNLIFKNNKKNFSKQDFKFSCFEILFLKIHFLFFEISKMKNRQKIF